MKNNIKGITAVEVMIIIAIIGILISIGIGGVNQRKKVIKEGRIDNMITVIEGCQYIRNPSYGGSIIYTHKGNCNNPIHIYNTNAVEKSWR